MSIYSIKDLERFSGIKAGTLRIWESRYNLLSPKRSATNIRSYNNDDLKHIMNVGFLNKRGIKISKIADLSPKQIHEKVIDFSERQFAADVQIEQFFLAMLDYNEELFMNVFANCVQKIGFEQTIKEVVYPFLQKLGVMWHAGIVNPGQEHFIMQLIRQKLIVAIDGLKISGTAKSPKFMLFLPENEFHELALLFYNYWLRARGYSTVFLGQSLPYEDIVKANKKFKPDFLLTVITCPKEEFSAKSYFKLLCSDFPKTKIFVSGSSELLSTTKLPKNIFLFRNPQDFEQQLKKTL